MSDIRTLANGTTQVGGISVSTPYEEKDKGVQVEDFLQLMIAQLKNQDMMNPVDDTQYVTQLAQFATMQSMQELSHYSQTNYVMSMVGKTVTAASYGIGGAVNKETGTVSKVNFSGDEFTVTVNGKEFKLSQIMSVDDPTAAVTQSQLDNANKLTPVIQSTTSDSIKLRWDAPVSDSDAASTLKYAVYYTDNGQVAFDDVSDVKNKGNLAASGLSGQSYTINGLEAGKTYFINVVVTDKNGNEAVYQHATTVTKDS